MLVKDVRDTAAKLCELCDECNDEGELLSRQGLLRTVRKLHHWLQYILEAANPAIDEFTQPGRRMLSQPDERTQSQPDRLTQPRSEGRMKSRRKPTFKNHSRHVCESPQHSSQSGRLGALNNSKKIESPNFAFLIPIWRNAPAHFFRPPADQVKQSSSYDTNLSVPRFLLGDAASDDPVESESKQQIKDIAARQRRFRMMGTWMLKSIFDPNDIPLDLINRMAEIGHGWTSDRVQETFKTSATIGKRYCRFIANFNEPDVLMAFSDDAIPRSTIENWWPLDRAQVPENAIQSLKGRGILETAKTFDGLTIVLLQFLFHQLQEYAFVHTDPIDPNARKRRRVAIHAGSHNGVVSSTPWDYFFSHWLTDTPRSDKQGVPEGSDGRQLERTSLHTFADIAVGQSVQHTCPVPPLAVEVGDSAGNRNNQDTFDIENYVYLNQPTFLPLPEDLEERLKDTWRLDWNGCPKVPVRKRNLVAQKAVPFPRELCDLVLLSLQSGAPKDESKARISAVMHLLRTHSDQTLPRFVRDGKNEYFHPDNRLHLAIIEEDMCITKKKEEEERFVWIKFFTEKNWDWVDEEE
ncbi:hypothetical protein PG988_006585 [Apiospora saccharicola]